MLLNGSVQSTFADGQPNGPRTLSDGSAIDLTGVANMANCGNGAGCSAMDLIGNATGDRPWGANNPVWRMFAYGTLGDMMPPGSISSSFYVTLMVGDDPSETDGDPTKDDVVATNPGSAVLALRAEAFGSGGVHKTIEVIVSRNNDPPSGNTGIAHSAVRVLSWREVR